MKVCLLAADVAPRTGQIIENRRSVFEGEENFLKMIYINFLFRLHQLSGIAFES